MRTVEIAAAKTAAHVLDARRLFRAYAATLSVSLAYQGFEDEVAGLPGAYAPPRGALLLARSDGAPVGCVALRPLPAAGECEIKRLYADPRHRGLGIGRDLATAAVRAARSIGYRIVRLDTLASMTAAQRLYADLGFIPTPPYYAPTPGGTVFMALSLPAGAPPSGDPVRAAAIRPRAA